MAAERVKLEVKERELIGSRESRRLRREGLVPGVLYGRGKPPHPICVPERELRRALTGGHGLHVILDVVLEGQKTTHASILKEAQQDPIKGRVIHVDLQDADPTYVKTSNLEPPSQFLPPDYQLAPNTAEPRMGSHYADVTSAELKPGNFSNIFLIGVHGGNILFWEPMITKEYLETKPNFTAQLKLPKAYPVSGYYPTAYSVVYDQSRQEFNISLDGLTFRLASYPENVYGVDACIDSRVAQMIAKYRRIPDDPAIQRCISLLRDVLAGK